MPPKLIHAKSELRDAERALLSMQRATSFSDFESFWKAFLGSVQKVWVKLKLECKSLPGFGRWNQNLMAQRDADPLLSYLFQARNANEHTICETMRHDPGSFSAVTGTHPSGTVTINKLTFGAHGEITEYSGNVPLHVTVVFPRIVLLPIVNYSVRFEVPKSHLGHPLSDGSPLSVAELAVAFYKQTIAEAERIFS